MRTYENVLITGADGYIGTFLAQAFPGAMLVDCSITSDWSKENHYHRNVCDIVDLEDAIDEHVMNTNIYIDTVIHAASLVSVAESVKDPFSYFSNNLRSTMNVIEILQNTYIDKPKIIFLSSQTAKYQDTPYAESKYFCERIIQESGIDYAILRLDNVAGASEDGTLGFVRENPTHLIESLVKNFGVKYPTIYGTDYETRDGTAERGYIWVGDVVNAVRLALFKLTTPKGEKKLHVNVKAPERHTVKEVINLFYKLNNEMCQYRIEDRRAGEEETVEFSFDPHWGHKSQDWYGEKDLKFILNTMIKFHITK